MSSTTPELFSSFIGLSGSSANLAARKVYYYNSINNPSTTFTLPNSNTLTSGDIITLVWANVGATGSAQHELTVTIAGGVGKPGLDHRAYGTNTIFAADTAATTAVFKTRGQPITLIYDGSGRDSTPPTDKFYVEMGTRFLGQLLDLDLDTSAPASGEFLKYDGTNWISEQIASGDVSGLGTAATSAATDFLSGTGADTLGGNLDVGSSSIVSSSNADIAISPNGTGQILLDGDGTLANGGVSIENGLVDIKNSGSGPSEIRLYCESSNAHYVGFKSAPHGAGSANYSLSLPEALPNSAQYLKTDTNGNLSWDTPGGGGGSFPLITSITGAFTVGGTGDTTNPVAIGASELERIYLVDTSAAITVTLPDASTVNAGFKLQIKRMGSHNITLDPSTGTVDGSSNQVLSVQYSSFTLVSDGSTTDWHII